MLTKLTVKNQLTLPKAVASQFKGVEYFDVSTDGLCDYSEAAAAEQSPSARAVPLADLGITEEDVSDAIAWARGEQVTAQSRLRVALTQTPLFPR